MVRPRPGHVLLVVACLPLLLGPSAGAQPQTPTGVSPQANPGELYRDVQVLKLVADLQLETAQVANIVPVVAQVAERAAADQQADEAAWALAKEAAGKVLAALTAGVDPPPEATAALDQAARARNQREDARAALVADAAMLIQRMLSAEQAAKIESAAEQARRWQFQRRLEGAETPVDYIVMKLEEQAELMPDEYLRTRGQRALETAQAILGPEAPGADALAEALLRVMNEVASWTPEQYAQQRPTLGKQVAQALNLPPPPEQHKLRYEEFAGWITSDRTPIVLRELLAARQSAEAKEGTAP